MMFPLTIKGTRTNYHDIEYKDDNLNQTTGKYCTIRFMDEDRIYLGIAIGPVPVPPKISITEDMILERTTENKLGLLVFGLNKVVISDECEYKVIEDENDLEKVNDPSLKEEWIKRVKNTLNLSL